MKEHNSKEHNSPVVVQAFGVVPPAEVGAAGVELICTSCWPADCLARLAPGLDYLWRLVLDAPEAVSADARSLLVRVHTQLGGDLAAEGPAVQAAFLRCAVCDYHTLNPNNPES